MQISKKQRALTGLRKVNKHLVAVIGSIRSGKTYWSGIGFAELMIWQQKEHFIMNGNRYAIVGHANQDATNKNVAIAIKEHLMRRGFSIQPHGKYDVIAKREEITIYLELFSVSDSVSYRRLQGGTYRSVLLDEAPLYPGDSIERIIERCATFKDHRVIMTGNAEGNDAHPFYQKYLKDNDEVFHMKFNMLDNPLNDEDTIDYYRKIFTPQTFKQRVMGEWVAQDGAVYPVPPLVYKNRPDKFDFILCGLDYGESDATSVVAIGVDVPRETYYVIDQFYHKNGNGQEYTIKDYTIAIENFIVELKEREQTRIHFTVETSPSTVYNTLKNSVKILANCTIQKVKKKRIDKKNLSSIRERIDIANALIGYGKLYIRDTEMPIYKAFKNAIYKNNTRLDNGTTDIDSLDAFEYGLSPDFKAIYNNYFKGGKKDDR